ncbi:LysR family transcriptional regulator [Paraferrimonas sedimenticola]|uniref:LysR family transcriptional regulator n=1 Tax=Paraferrimonas sedimenticola TaxID=375674 RepID=A0AA37RV58_9GAMM|nr:LysR family transcriptional regulator [Paraferrimonas sedimenticola]GLP96305.1 LysR family transcriptional regulator [Paraferrimonas sedimenticola]
MKFSLDQLEAFAHTAELGSFKLAAKRLGKHSTTISQHVATLEIDAGLTLFERHVRRLEITEEGKDFLSFAKPVLMEAGQLIKKVDNMNAQQPSEFRLAIETTIQSRQFMRCANSVLQRFPLLKLKVLSGDSLQVATWVSEGKADVGIFNTLFTSFENVTPIQLFSYEMITVCAPNWIEQSNVINESDIRAKTQLVYQYVEQSPQLEGHIQSHHYHVVQNLTDLVDMVTLGMGWAIVPRFKVEQQLEDGDLVEFFIEGSANVQWYTELLLPSDQPVNSVVKCFIQEVQKLPNR